MSTFHGLEVAKRALSAQQSALYTTSHNIANANTEGYSRQRVNFEQTAPYPPASRNRPHIPGQLGSGVEAGSIERVRDQFLDVQYRGENSKLGYYQTRADAMAQMETIMNEPSEQGLANTMDQFWQALQDLSVNPEDSGARSVVRQRGIAVSETFNYLSGSLNAVRGDLKNEIDVTTKEVNSLINQINNVNKQIGDVEPHGYLPNDLYDERDRLIDKLSGLAEIKVSYVKSGGQPSPTHMGKATVTLVGNGEEEIKLVDATTSTVNNVAIGYDDDNNVQNLTFYNPADLPTADTDPTTLPADQKTVLTTAAFSDTGKLRALIEANGYITDNGQATGEFNSMLDDLDSMASAFVAEFNKTHQEGANLADDQSYDFFAIEGEGRPAALMDVTDDIKGNIDLIAASLNGDSGDGTNAEQLSNVFSKLDTGLGAKTSIKSFYESAIGKMAVVTQEANRMVNNATVLRQQVDENRQSVSAVSLDEEMTNMIKFQHAYNAAARSMTTVDEMLDRIINNMGLVGR
ncbi:flagellar hook-associated protein FlgK [Aquibacillus koreensis]|uniref:Flagellar hook-associated protein 1 n=1 Tax=Aquibacillus koreensis TaxID=279446 RepID=A0A9X4AKN3_9BACI|nr:flagellar hook-associated protein FlgK [Aquibacillus koreensis]MCT2537252.1 flagellar hook-associated protein FlgK [Aquibacillus koreensis]MDC3421600.1 flagellar hook-associated protein FlgK [Aquibacillus koreensis]